MTTPDEPHASPPDASEPTTTPPILRRVVVVLCEPQDPINIGNTVRAMKNMGLTRLRLVRPADPNPDVIQISAPRAGDLIQSIEVFDTLDDALADTVLTVAMTARGRAARQVVQRPRDAAPELLQHAALGPVALLFGREDRGLTNAQIDRAERVITIPTRPDYSSLNLGQAVLLIAYELFLAADQLPDLPTPKRDAPLATHRELEGLYGQIEQTLERIEFIKSGSGANIHRALRGVFQRAELDQREARILRGIFVEVVKFVERKLG